MTIAERAENDFLPEEVEYPAAAQGVISSEVDGWTILGPAHGKPHRRVLYLNSYGMATVWPAVRAGDYPGAHLWGCIELARMGYEVAMPQEPDRTSPFYNYRRQDGKHLGFARSWLGKEGILYSAHTVLFWAPLLSQLRLLRCPIVTLLYARGENLRFPAGYSGVLALTPAAEARARELAPNAKRAHIRWGVDLQFFPDLPYSPKWFLNCGKTRRDFATLAGATSRQPLPLHLINNEAPDGVNWPDKVKLITGGRGGDWQSVSYRDLIHEHYSGAAAATIVLQEDATGRYGAGFTQLLEAMALGRPVIVTRTGALADEIDVEKVGCGLHVPPNDAAALADAMRAIADDSGQSWEMGLAGRRLCERVYNIDRFGEALHEFFEGL
jgi:hypothetical protein